MSESQENGKPVPLYAAFVEDFVWQVLPAESTETLSELAEKYSQLSAGRFFPEKDGPIEIIIDGEVADLDQTVEEAGLEPKEPVKFRYARDA